jgi:hypothetical protein
MVLLDAGYGNDSKLRVARASTDKLFVEGRLK